MRRILQVAILIFSFVGAISAQNNQQYSLYFLNPGSFNPAATGVEENIILTGGIRNQWSALPGSPVSQHANVQFGAQPLAGGLGLYFEQNQLGLTRGSKVGLSYAYNYYIGNTGRLRLGTSLYWQNFSIDGSLIRTPDGTYNENIFDHEDNFLSSGLMQGNSLAADAGVYFISNAFEVGLSVNNVFESSRSINGLDLYEGRAYYVYVANSFEVGRHITFTPSVLLKTILSQSQLEGSVKFVYDDNIVFGGSFRGYNETSVDSVIPFVGYFFGSGLSLYYGYDIGISALQSVHGGSHELLIRYDLGKAVWKGKLPPIIYNQRYKR